VNVLVLNCGSATLKFGVIASGEAGPGRRIAGGLVDRIGSEAVIQFEFGARRIEESVPAADYRAALDVALGVLEGEGLLAEISAAGHRVVHGGLEFQRPVLIDDAAIAGIRKASDLAPLHNARALQVIERSRERLKMPMVACFDTAFFAGLPPEASTYALPAGLVRKHGIRRFGFHGLAHSYMARRYRELRPDVTGPRLVTLQLGNGCSATATMDGRPIQTSMGYTPLEGLVMGTRSGNIDPALALRLPALTGMTAAAVEDLLNKQSGLLGVSGRSADMRELLEGARAGDAACELAIAMFCWRTKEYAGAYMALMNGADAVIFGGGIGEHSPEVRARILGNLGSLGIELDAAANDAATGREALISTPASLTEVWVVSVDEASVIAEETARVLA
jgi:acetate kinase